MKPTFRTLVLPFLGLAVSSTAILAQDSAPTIPPVLEEKRPDTPPPPLARREDAPDRAPAAGPARQKDPAGKPEGRMPQSRPDQAEPKRDGNRGPAPERQRSEARPDGGRRPQPESRTSAKGRDGDSPHSRKNGDHMDHSRGGDQDTRFQDRDRRPEGRRDGDRGQGMRRERGDNSRHTRMMGRHHRRIQDAPQRGDNDRRMGSAGPSREFHSPMRGEQRSDRDQPCDMHRGPDQRGEGDRHMQSPSRDQGSRHGPDLKNRGRGQGGPAPFHRDMRDGKSKRGPDSRRPEFQRDGGRDGGDRFRREDEGSFKHRGDRDDHERRGA